MQTGGGINVGAGLNAIVNIHHDGADSEYWLSIKDAAQDETKNTAIKTELKAVWTQIAERFKDKFVYKLIVKLEYKYRWIFLLLEHN